MAHQTPVPCPYCERTMRPGGLPAHVRAHTHHTTVPADDQERIVQLYATGLPIAAVSTETYWSKTTVRTVLLINGVTLRRAGGNIHEQITVDEQLKRSSWYGRGYSLSEVAAICGVTTSSVQHTLMQLGTPRRSRSEANKLYWQHKKNRSETPGAP